MRTCVIGSILALAMGCSDQTFSSQNGDDEWAQAPNNEVDILFVVDNSFSMEEEQAALAAGFPEFIGEMENTNTDFHLGLISTSFEYDDPNRGLLIGDEAKPYLTNNDDYVNEFLARVKLGTTGSDKEKGLEAAEFALSPALQQSGRNAGFLRTEAQLLIVMVSDEEDCSDNFALEGQPAESCYSQMDDLTPVEHFVDAFQNLKTNPDYFQFASIVGLDNSCPAAFPGNRYLQVSGYTNGVVGSICSAEWSSIMYRVGLNASSTKVSFTLTNAAVDDETFQVFVDLDGTASEPADEEADDTEVERSETNGWTYDNSVPAIVFHGDAIPPRGATISAKYVIDPNGPSDGG
jgi:hypothetical protein